MESSTHEVASIRTSFIYLQLLAQDDHGSDFHLETFLLALKLMDKLDNVHMKLMMIDSGCTTVNI